MRSEKWQAWWMSEDVVDGIEEAEEDAADRMPAALSRWLVCG